MLMSTDRQISSHQIILQFLVFVNDAETVWIQLTVNYDHEWEEHNKFEEIFHLWIARNYYTEILIKNVD